MLWRTQSCCPDKKFARPDLPKHQQLQREQLSQRGRGNGRGHQIRAKKHHTKGQQSLEQDGRYPCHGHAQLWSWYGKSAKDWWVVNLSNLSGLRKVSLLPKQCLLNQDLFMKGDVSMLNAISIPQRLSIRSLKVGAFNIASFVTRHHGYQNPSLPYLICIFTRAEKKWVMT